MKKLLRLSAASLMVFFICIAAVPAAEDEIKLKIRAGGGQIRLEPGFESEVIKILPEGTEIKAEKKTGDWYRVTVPNQEGYDLSGYIHFKQADRLPGDFPEASPPPEKKPAPIEKKDLETKGITEERLQTVRIDFSKEKKIPRKPRQSLIVSLGLGYLYGESGISAEFKPMEFLGLFGTIGLGPKYNVEFYEFWKKTGVSFAAGVRFYPLSLLPDFSASVHPRVGVSYGYNGLHATMRYVYSYPYTYRVVSKQTFLTGINVSAGVDFEVIYGIGLNADFVLPVTRWGYRESNGYRLANAVENLGFNLSLGIRYGFEFN